MELKSYFKKYGKGWIVVGFLLTLLLIVVSLMELFNREAVVTQASKVGLSESKYLFSYAFGLVISSILIPLFFVLVPFLIGFFGLIRLFWFIIVGEILYYIITLLESGSPNNWGVFFIGIPLLFLAVLVGVIWEVIHYYRFKKSVS